MTPEGRQDLAAVIAEMRDVVHETRLANISNDVVRVVGLKTVKHWLALLLAEAQLSSKVQVQEHTEVARVDAMGNSTDNPTASEHETTPATVSLNQVSNEPR